MFAGRLCHSVVVRAATSSNFCTRVLSHHYSTLQRVLSVLYSVFRIALPELLPTPPSTHTSLQLEKHYIGCRLSTVLSLRLPCWYISSYTVVTPNTLNPSLFPDVVHITHVEVNLMAYFLRFPTLLQCSSLENILDSVLRMTHL